MEDLKKEIIELLQNADSESALRFVIEFLKLQK